MKRIFALAIFIAAGTTTAAAQNQGELDKHLEVTRAYTPRVGQANKLEIKPDMTDTVRLRPETTYSIKTTASATTFVIQPFEAAKMNAAPFEMRRPFYLRAGIGVPFQSLGDLYYAPRMRNNRTFGIYANHRGSWADITNDIDVRSKAANKYFEAGIFGSKHLDSLENYIISGELAYDLRGYELYGVQSGDIPQLETLSAPIDRRFAPLSIIRDRVRGNIAIGDNFLDLSHFNYRVGIGGAFSRIDNRENQSDFDFNFRAAQMYGEKRDQGFEATMKVRAAVDLDDKSGYRMPNGIRYSETGVYGEDELIREPNWIPEGGAVAVTIEPRYVVRGKFANMKIGFVARYVNNGAWNQNYLAITPSFEANFNVARGVFVPFLSYTSQIVDGSSEALSRRNPYVYPGYSAPTGWINDARAGFAGDLGDVFSYRISGGMSLLNDYHVLTAVQEIITRQPTAESTDDRIDVEYLPVWFEPRTTDGARFTLGAEFGVRGIGGFSGRLYANWNKFDFSGVWKSKPDQDGGMPDPVGDMSPWDGGLEVVYNHRKMLNVRLDAHLIGTRQYNITYIEQKLTDIGLVREDMPGKGRIKPVVDLSLAADYEVLTNFWIFAEGHNLTGMKLYPYPTYRGTGASLIAGIKLAF